MTVTLDDDALAIFCPFHFRLDRDLRFTAISPVLARLLPELAAGALFVEQFHLERPIIKIDFAAMADCARVMFLLRARQRPGQQDLILRGQMLYLAATDDLLFVGNPRVRDLGDLKRLGLTMRDFAVDSTLPDYLVLIQTQQTALDEAQRLALDLARARDAALMASNSKSEFLANMSHELRTPLNAILGFSDMIRSQLAGPLTGTYQQYADDIHTSGQLLLLIINDVLDMARIEAGYHQLDEDHVDVDVIMRDCIHLLAGRAAEHAIAITFDNQLPDRMIKADARAIKQICLNLLSNAIKFNKRGGSVEISLGSEEERGLIWRFSDSGIGIPDADQPRLFRPFQQAGATVARRVGGTGLGLSITRNLVELHGGSIELQSALDQGSTFTVILPGHRLV
jgi:signal transduction histidine kinase